MEMEKHLKEQGRDRATHRGQEPTGQRGKRTWVHPFAPSQHNLVAKGNQRPGRGREQGDRVTWTIDLLGRSLRLPGAG